MKKFYGIFVISGIYITSECDNYSEWSVYSEGHAVIPYWLGGLFETKEEAEQWLENDLNCNTNEYRDCQFVIQKVYMRNNSNN